MSFTSRYAGSRNRESLINEESTRFAQQPTRLIKRKPDTILPTRANDPVYSPDELRTKKMVYVFVITLCVFLLLLIFYDPYDEI